MKEILAIFEDDNWKIITENIARYAKFSAGEQNISEVIVDTTSDSGYWQYTTHRHKEILVACTEIYLSGTRRALASAIPRLNTGYNRIYVSNVQLDQAEGFLYKAHKMIDLANKLGRPVVVGPTRNNPKCISQAKTVFDGIIDLIRPYHHYVNVVISSTHTIQMSLKQVIETSLGENRYEKSTLSILDHAYSIDNAYNSICDELWDHLMKQEDHDMTLEHYNEFKSRLTYFIKGTVSRPHFAFITF